MVFNTSFKVVLLVRTVIRAFCEFELIACNENISTNKRNEVILMILKKCLCRDFF